MDTKYLFTSKYFISNNKLGFRNFCFHFISIIEIGFSLMVTYCFQFWSDFDEFYLILVLERIIFGCFPWNHLAYGIISESFSGNIKAKLSAEICGSDCWSFCQALMVRWRKWQLSKSFPKHAHSLRASHAIFKHISFLLSSVQAWLDCLSLTLPDSTQLNQKSIKTAKLSLLN